MGTATPLKLTSWDRRSLILILTMTVNAPFVNLSVSDSLAGLRPYVIHSPQESF